MDASGLETLLLAKEDERLEFKEAKQGFHFEELVKYCCALANEGGGRIILGMTDRPPRRIVGSEAFDNLERTRAGLTERLRIRVHTTAFATPEGRVVVFEVPSRPLGVPLSYKGAYWMRSGEELLPMTEDRLRTIFDEARPDFSATICQDASLEDLDREGVEHFRGLWQRKSGRADLGELSTLRLLEDAELVLEGRPTHAALILFGTSRALGRHLAQAELIFEYRDHESQIDYQQREDFRSGFLLVLNAVWELIQRRNALHHFQDGLFRRDIRTFNETVVREVLLNAISHRDYRHAGSIYVRQWPQRVAIVSPGGLPPGISPTNIFFRQLPRNRRIAEALARCGLVERSGQGANRMLSLSLGEGKSPPDFTDTDEHQVSVTLHGTIRDPRLIRFFESITAERRYSFRTEDFLAVDAILGGRPVPEVARARLPELLDVGVLERLGRGRIGLAARFYQLASDRAASTRKRGLDHGANKALLLKHIRDNAADGSPFDELTRVLPNLNTNQIKGILRELRSEGEIHARGRTRAARWHPGPGDSSAPIDPNQF